jgi:hypothetical protein
MMENNMLFAMSDRYITVVVSFALFHIWHGGVNRWNVPSQIASWCGPRYYIVTVLNTTRFRLMCVRNRIDWENCITITTVWTRDGCLSYVYGTTGNGIWNCRTTIIRKPWHSHKEVPWWVDQRWTLCVLRPRVGAQKSTRCERKSINIRTQCAGCV